MKRKSNKSPKQKDNLNKADEIKNGFECHQCNFKSTSKAGLSTHKRRNHDKITQLDGLENDVDINTDDEDGDDKSASEDDDRNDDTKCQSCSQDFKDIDELVKHYKTEHVEFYLESLA